MFIASNRFEIRVQLFNSVCTEPSKIKKNPYNDYTTHKRQYIALHSS